MSDVDGTEGNCQLDAVSIMLAADAASRSLDIRLVDHGPGWARTSMIVRADMLNGHAIAHGGPIFTLADTAFACACNSWGPTSVAAGCDITFIAPARLGDILDADAQVRTRYGRHGVYDVTVRSGETVVAEFRGRSHQLKAPQA